MPGGGDGHAIYRHLSGDRFGDGVGGHDRLRSIEPVIRRHVRHSTGHTGGDLRDWQRLHDHTGREWQYLVGLAAQQSGQCCAGGARITHALLAGSGIGIAGVNQQRADAARLGEVLARDDHRRGTEAIPGEYTSDPRALAQLHHQQVLAVGPLDIRFRDAQRNARNGQQLYRNGGCQIDWHKLIPNIATEIVASRLALGKPGAQVPECT